MKMQNNIEVIVSGDSSDSIKLKITNVGTKEDSKIAAEEWCDENNSLLTKESFQEESVAGHY